MAPSDRNGGTGSTSPIEWRPWGRAAFEEAVAADRPVLLNLTAVWCYLCRHMEETTYADPARAETINSGFVPVRVDVDRLPHVQERYIAGGWPTNTFLTPTGEVLWAGTYIGPEEFDEVAQGVLTAWRDRRDQLRAEVSRRRKALEAARNRQPTMALVRREAADDVVSAVKHSFDARNGGFGEAPKFPYPDAVDLLFVESRLTRDPAFVDMADRTLDGMLAGELWDCVDGGFFRYALAPDWTAPRLEKLLDPNATLLRTFALGAAVRGRTDWRERAEAIVAWADATLAREDGLWSASQLAEEEYWGLDANERRRRGAPAPDSTVYSAQNAYWIRALAEAGGRLGRADWIERAAAAMPRVLDTFAAPGDLLYHFRAEGEAPAVDGVLMDSLEAARACITLAQAAGSGEFLAEAVRLVKGMEAALWADAGGFYDHVPSSDDVAALLFRDRPFEANSDAARLLLDLCQATGERSYRALAERILATLSPMAGRYEIGGAAFALGVEEFFEQPATVVIVGTPEETAPLRSASLCLPEPNLRVWTLPTGGSLGGRRFAPRPAPAAYVFGHHGASPALTDPSALAQAVVRAR